MLKEYSMFNNYFNDYIVFTSILKGKLPLKFSMPDIKVHGINNPYYHTRNFLSAMELKRIDKDIFHIIFT